MVTQIIDKGYKQTDLGVLPEDWTIKAIGDFSKVVRGGSPRPAGDPKYFNGNFIPWLTVAALTNIPEHQLFVNKTDDFLTEEGSKLSRILPKNTLIISNSGATLGVAKILNMKSCANDGIAAVMEVSDSINKIYLLYFINSITERLRENIATGNGQPNLNTTLISEIRVPLPPTTKEQSEIAAALSHIDKLIESLDTLIVKKKNFKEGAMQELLTGKKRLHGEWVNKNGLKLTEVGLIPEDWQISSLKDLGSIDTDNLSADTPTDYEFDYISLESIDKGKLNQTQRLTFGNAPSRQEEK